MRMALYPMPQDRSIVDNGSWSSRLGSWQDNEYRIFHALEGTVSFCGYGNLALFFRRPAEISSESLVASYFLVAYLPTGYYMVHQFTDI